MLFFDHNFAITISDSFCLISLLIYTERAPRRALLNSTDDLISRFQLLPAYDKYVRPYIHSQPTSELHAKSTPGALPFSGGVYAAPTPGAFDKGKGREILVGTPQTPAAAPTPAADAGEGGDGEEEEGAKGDKKKKNYRFLIKDIPGEPIYTLLFEKPEVTVFPSFRKTFNAKG